MNEIRLLVFIDILGFKEIIRDSRKLDEILRLLESIRDRNSNFHLQIQPQNGMAIANFIPDFISFSDHLIMSYPLGNDQYCQSNNFQMFSNDLSRIIYELHLQSLKLGFLLRGAVAVGEMYYDRERVIIFGNNLNEAIQDESRLAVYPRVVASESYIRFLADRNENNPFMEEDFDGMYFYNYAAFIRRRHDSALLTECNRIIDENMRAHEFNLNYFAKWKWLKDKLSANHA